MEVVFATRYPCASDVIFCELGVLGYAAVGSVARGFVGYSGSTEGRRGWAAADALDGAFRGWRISPGE